LNRLSARQIAIPACDSSQIGFQELRRFERSALIVSEEGFQPEVSLRDAAPEAADFTRTDNLCDMPINLPSVFGGLTLSPYPVVMIIKKWLFRVLREIMLSLAGRETVYAADQSSPDHTSYA